MKHVRKIAIRWQHFTWESDNSYTECHTIMIKSIKSKRLIVMCNNYIVI